MGSLDVAARKRAIREEALSARERLTQSERHAAAERACARLFASDIVRGHRIMLFAAFGSEMPTLPMLERALSLGMSVAYPRVKRAERRMEAACVTGPHQLVPGVMDILEPELSIPALDPRELSTIIVPGLAFDRRGYRIGYGGGYYDRFLPTAPHAMRIGLTFSHCVYETLPVESHDEKVDWILTETELFAASLA